MGVPASDPLSREAVSYLAVDSEHDRGPQVAVLRLYLMSRSRTGMFLAPYFPLEALLYVRGLLYGNVGTAVHPWMA